MARELARLEVSQGRRVVGVALQGLLGFLLLYVVAVQPSGNVAGRIILAAVGCALVWFAWQFWRSTETALVLTTDGLLDSNGRPFCTFNDIEKLDRGFFAFRPSGGFLIVTKEPVQRGWSPGLWWAFGRRIGVGGSTSRPAGKQMADIISVMLTERGDEIRAQKPD